MSLIKIPSRDALGERLYDLTNRVWNTADIAGPWHRAPNNLSEKYCEVAVLFSQSVVIDVRAADEQANVHEAGESDTMNKIRLEYAAKCAEGARLEVSSRILAALVNGPLPVAAQAQLAIDQADELIRRLAVTPKSPPAP